MNLIVKYTYIISYDKPLLFYLNDLYEDNVIAFSGEKPKEINI